MDHDLKGNGSDSDISDSWTILNCSEQDEVLQDNIDHVEASDEESVESFGVEIQELHKREEESDGISIISESDICDNTETIPVQLLSRSENSGNLTQDEEICSFDLQHSPKRRGRNNESFSESDGCELVDSPTNLSLALKKGRKQRGNRSLTISELDNSDNVDHSVFPTASRMYDENGHCMRIYVHRPNDQVNYLLTILLALALAAVAGLGTGHFLGTKEVLMTPEETVYRFQKENEILHNQLQELLREHEEWRRNFEHIILASCRNIDTSNNLDPICSKIINNFIYFQNTHTLLTPSSMKGYVPSSIISQTLGSNYPNSNMGLENFKDVFISKNKFSEAVSKSNLNMKSGGINPVLETTQTNHIFENNPKFFTKTNYIQVNEYNEKETEFFVDEVKSALANSIELANKLKEAISNLDNAYISWKKLNSDVSSGTNYNPGIGKEIMKGLKDTLHDSDRAKYLLSKTVEDLDAMKIKFSEKTLEDFIPSHSEQNFKPIMAESSDFMSDNVCKSYLNSSVNFLQNNHSLWMSNSAVLSGIIYGPHLPNSSHILFQNIPDPSIYMGEIKKDKVLMNEDSDVNLIGNALHDKTAIKNMYKETLSAEDDNSNIFLSEDQNQIHSHQFVADNQNGLQMKENPSKLIDKMSKEKLSGTEKSNQNTKEVYSEVDIQEYYGQPKLEDRILNEINKNPKGQLSQNTHSMGVPNNEIKTQKLKEKYGQHFTKEKHVLQEQVIVNQQDGNRSNFLTQGKNQEPSKETNSDLQIEPKSRESPAKHTKIKNKKSQSGHNENVIEMSHKQKKICTEQGAGDLCEQKKVSDDSSFQNGKYEKPQFHKKPSRAVSKEEVNGHNQKRKLKEKSNKHFTKQKSIPKDKYSNNKKDKSSSDEGKNYKYESKKKQKNKEQKSWKGSKKERSFQKDLKSEKEWKLKYKPGSEESHEFKNKFPQKPYYKENDLKQQYEKTNKNKDVNKKDKYFKKKDDTKKEKYYKNKDDTKKEKYFEKEQTHKKQRDIKYRDQMAWSVDEHGYRHTNLSGEWLLKMNQARSKQRERTHKSDWIFDRAASRRTKREDQEKSHWYFKRARSRENCRVGRDSDQCKAYEKDSRHFQREGFWKGNRDFNNDDHDNFQRNWRTKYSAKNWKGTRFVSNMFRAAMNFVKA